MGAVRITLQKNKVLLAQFASGGLCGCSSLECRAGGTGACTGGGGRDAGPSGGFLLEKRVWALVGVGQSRGLEGVSGSLFFRDR